MMHIAYRHAISLVARKTFLNANNRNTKEMTNTVHSTLIAASNAVCMNGRNHLEGVPQGVAARGRMRDCGTQRDDQQHCPLYPTCHLFGGALLGGGGCRVSAAPKR